MANLTKRQALEELARRKGVIASQGTFPIEQYLFDKQLAFVNDPAPFKIAVTTRRAGKTIACVSDLISTALLYSDCIVLYITLSRRDAKRGVWKAFKLINERFQLNGLFNESELSITFPNGSQIYLAGAADRTSIEDFRGLSIKKVYIDEAQTFPAYIKELIDDVLAPALMDNDGSMVLIGTPGPIPSGYFYDLTKNEGWSHHSWTFFDNNKWPALVQGITHQMQLDRELKRRGVTITDPSIQREWFGKWIVDINSLVYHYNALKNDYKALPEGSWTYVLGVDLGFEDADALALIAYSEAYAETYVIEEVVTRHQDLTALCGQIDKLIARYPITKIVVDTGGLGKKITEEISKRYSIPMVAAEKIRKTEYIELMNDALRTGTLKIKATSQFAFDSQKVEWDWDHSTPDKKVISKKFHSDICEAVLYAWRESYAYTYKAPRAEPEFGTKEWSNQEADNMFNATLERLENDKEQLEGYEPPPFDPHSENIQRLVRPTIRYQRQFDKRKKL